MSYGHNGKHDHRLLVYPYLVVIIVDSIVACFFGGLYSMAKGKCKEKLHHLGLKKKKQNANASN